jgi:hypothetical protein
VCVCVCVCVGVCQGSQAGMLAGGRQPYGGKVEGLHGIPSNCIRAHLKTDMPHREHRTATHKSV